ncbi:MAG: polysaccharide deacetylase family protein [Gemmatimonadales bacterium]
MRRRLLDLAWRTADRWPANRILAGLNRGRVAVLCYHSVVDGAVPPPLRRTGLHVRLADFEAQMEALARDFDVVPLAEALAGPVRRSRPAVALTFDDGYANNLHLAAPVLSRLGLPATIFLVSSLLSDERPFWWDEVGLLVAGGAEGAVRIGGERVLVSGNDGGAGLAAVRRYLRTAPLVARGPVLDELRGLARPAGQALIDLLRPLARTELAAFPSGIVFGNHTATHRVLTEIGPADVRWEIETARDELGAMLAGRYQDVLCYPRGSTDAATEKIVEATGTPRAVALARRRIGRSAAGAGSRPLAMPRIVVGAHFGLERFRLAARGLATG